MKQHRSAKMLLSVVYGFALSVVALSTLAAGDPGSIITIFSAKVTNNPNDYFGDWSAEIHETKKSSQLTVKIPTKLELTDAILLKLIFIMDGQDPIEYVSNVCEALEDESFGKSFVDAGVPKDKFPKECPFTAGDWTVFKWDPPKDKVPPGTPDGPISGSVMIMEEGKEPYVQIDFEGELSNENSMGRR